MEKCEENQLEGPCKNENNSKSQGERNIVHIINRRKANRIGHMLRSNCFLKQIIEGKTKETERRRRRKQLLDELKKREDTGN